MKAALIPPVPELITYGHGDFHLLLSHLFTQFGYKAHYATQRRRGAYLVLDNSAHEFRSGQRESRLRDQALSLKVQEVVVPDVLFDANQTIDRTEATLEAWYETGDTRMLDVLNPALMYVPQGKTEAEWVACLHEQLRMHAYFARKVRGFRKSFVVGISKDYDTWPGGLAHLTRTHIAPVRDLLLVEWQIQMHVHLLGWVRDLWNITALAKEFPWIRSTDTAKPFVYALAHESLGPQKAIPEYPGRPPDYWTSVFSTRQRHIATRNIRALRAAIV